ncbi:MAG TPA: aldo/keto reductase [Polyangiaceae bacterium]|jgi:aryl-alcohol dehydrogenase-like predicted oxidoreductase
METIELGRTGIRVSRICVGGMQYSTADTTSDQKFIATVRRAIEAGLNMLDTAPAYGDGHSEELVGEAIAGRRDQVVLATKFMHHEPGDVRKSLEASLRRLKTDYVDLFQQHWPFPKPPLAETLDALLELKREGKIRAIGVSNWMDPEWEEFSGRENQVDCLQPCHNLLWRSIEPKVLPLCKQHGIGIIPYSPLCQGVLSGRFRSRADLPPDWHRQNNCRVTVEAFPEVLSVLRVVEEVAKKENKTMGQVALRWLLDQEGITAPIVGMSKPEQVDDNLGALSWKLDPADWRKLADVSWPLSANLKPYDTLWNWHPKTNPS